jgi:hypothetical protein
MKSFPRAIEQLEFSTPNRSAGSHKKPVGGQYHVPYGDRPPKPVVKEMFHTGHVNGAQNIVFSRLLVSSKNPQWHGRLKKVSRLKFQFFQKFVEASPPKNMLSKRCFTQDMLMAQ